MKIIKLELTVEQNIYTNTNNERKSLNVEGQIYNIINLKNPNVGHSVNIAKEEDGHKISELIHYNFDNAEAYKDLEQNFKEGFKACNTKEKILLKIENNKNICFVVKASNGELVGFIAAKKIEIDGEKGYSINRWHIHPNHGGKGLGKKLINEVISYSRKKGFSFIELGPSNKTTEKIIESIGFTNSGNFNTKGPKRLPLFIKKI